MTGSAAQTGPAGTIETRLPTGVKDFLPVKAAKLEYLEATLRGVFARWGFRPVIPASLEELAVLELGLGGDLRGKRRRLARALEAGAAGGGPRQGVALAVGDGDDGVVERGKNMHLPGGQGTLAFLCASGAPRGTNTLSHVVSLLLFLSALAASATGNGLLGAFARAGIGACPLTMNRQIPAMAHPAIAANFNQTLNIQLLFTA